MIYVVAILLPPLALLFKGKIFQAIFNGLLWALSVLLLFTALIPVVGIISGMSFPIYLICVIWAMVVVKGANDDERTQKIVDAIKSKD